MGAVSFGVYVHVPFCAHRCDYCDFATWTDRGHLIHARKSEKLKAGERTPAFLTV